MAIGFTIDLSMEDTTGHRSRSRTLSRSPWNKCSGGSSAAASEPTAWNMAGAGGPQCIYIYVDLFAL